MGLGDIWYQHLYTMIITHTLVKSTSGERAQHVSVIIVHICNMRVCIQKQTAYQIIKSISLYFHSQVFRKQICQKMHFRRLRLCCVHVWKDSYSDNWETVLPTIQSHREHSPFTGMYFVTTLYVSLSSICLGPVSELVKTNQSDILSRSKWVNISCSFDMPDE